MILNVPSSSGILCSWKIPPLAKCYSEANVCQRKVEKGDIDEAIGFHRAGYFWDYRVLMPLCHDGTLEDFARVLYEDIPAFLKPDSISNIIERCCANGAVGVLVFLLERFPMSEHEQTLWSIEMHGMHFLAHEYPLESWKWLAANIPRRHMEKFVRDVMKSHENPVIGLDRQVQEYLERYMDE